MANKHTIVSKDSNNILYPNQLTSADADGRTWRYLNNAETEYLTLKTTDLYEVSNVNSSGTSTESTALTVSATNKITLAINRARTIAYVVYQDTLNDTYLVDLTLSTMTFGTPVDLGINIQVLRNIVNNDGDKILFSGNNTLYRCGLDGGSLETIGSLTAQSFSMDVNDQVVLRNGSSISIVDNNFTKTDYAQSSPFNNSSFYSKDSFIYDDYYYDLAVRSGVCYLVKWQISTQTLIDSVDLLTELSVASANSITNLFYYNGAGYFFVNDAGSNKYICKFDFATLTIVKGKYVNTEAERTAWTGTQQTRDAIGFTGSEAGIVAPWTCPQDSDNCDPSGLITSSSGVTGA